MIMDRSPAVFMFRICSHRVPRGGQHRDQAIWARAIARRSSPRNRSDKLAFPVRVRFVVPRYGLGGRSNDLHRWLTNEIGPGSYALHSSAAFAQDGLRVYLCEPVLADGTASRA